MKKCISVLEDDDSLRELFAILLEDEGYEVFTYETVKAFSKSLSDRLPDLFILDVRLPDGDGMQVCDLVKSDSLTKHIPVIMMSAHRNFELECGTCSAEAFIPKPFDIPVLLTVVNQQFAKI